MRPTFHLVPAETWDSTDRAVPYVADSLTTEGFVHCTDGVAALGETFDRHYGPDVRPFLALTLDLEVLDALGIPWRYDDAGSPYPHVYGPIAPDAIVAVQRVERHPDGRFRSLGPAAG